MNPGEASRGKFSENTAGQETEVTAEAVAIILAGGLGTRFGGAKPKQLAQLNGRPVLWHTLSRVVRPELFTACVIVANADWFTPIQDVVMQVGTAVPTVLVEGGQSRNESVWKAIQKVELSDRSKCIVHDGVRPLASEKLIRSVLDALDFGDSVIPVIDAVDPLIRVSDGRVIGIESRESVFRGQSPQGFNLGMIRRVFTEVGPEVLNNYSTIYEVLRYLEPETEIYTVEGEMNNLKITQPIDRAIAEELLTGGTL